MRTVVSVSMDPNMASRLKEAAAEVGQSFSARVCELIEAGEQAGRGLFERPAEEPTTANFGYVAPRRRPREVKLPDVDKILEGQDDDAPPLSLEGGDKTEGSGLESDTGSGTSAASDGAPTASDEIESTKEAVVEPRRSVPQGTPTERVYACVTGEKTSIRDVAKTAGIEYDETTKILDRLIDVDGEPIQVKLVAGEWFCWLDSEDN